MDLIIGLIVGSVVVSILAYMTFPKNKRGSVKEQSAVLLEKIRQVAKLVTIESDFSEILHHKDTKNMMLNIFKSDKKAIVLTNSKVMVGFDMKKIKIKPYPKKRIMVLTHFPKPQVISIETHVEYYDITNGMFNKFGAEELTKLNQKVKENIEAKIPESGILLTAQEKALETIVLIEQIVEAFGWHLDYDQWELPERVETKKLNADAKKD